MCYTNYLEKKIKLNDSIFIDTCSIMKAERFIDFMETAKELLESYDKKIIILGAVHDELKEKTRSEYYDVKTSATKALNYIYENRIYFDIRENESKETFADAQIQIVMLNNRRTMKQLLISNDVNLTKDVYRFNENKSVYGFHINVCYLDKKAELCMCDCVRENKVIEESITIQNVEPEIQIVKEVEVKTIEKVVKEELSTFDKYVVPFAFLGF